MYYLLGGLAMVLAVAGAYAFSSGDLFQGALRPVKFTTVTDVKKTTTPTSKKLPKDDTAITEYALTPSDADATTIQTAASTIRSVSIDKKFFKPDVETLKITYDLQGVSPAIILYVVIYDNDGNNVYRRQFTAAEKRANFTVLNKNLTYAGANTPVQWPYTLPTITNLTVKENTYVSSTGKYRVKVAFDLYASSSANQIWMGFRDANGVQYNDWTFKDLPNGKYELFWDGMRYNGEMINTWTQPNYILNANGYDNNVYRPEMANELKLTLPANY